MLIDYYLWHQPYFYERLRVHQSIATDLLATKVALIVFVSFLVAVFLTVYSSIRIRREIWHATQSLELIPV